MSAHRLPRAQRGVALIMAVLIVALATILAVDVGFKAYLDQRRAATSFALEQAFEVAKGAEAWAADILKEDGASGSKRDDLTERWATPLPPLPIDGGELEGQLQDLQGRFNLNTLIVADQTGKIVTNQPAYEQLVRLLGLLNLETHWAAKITDWIDPDDNPVNNDGAEDSIYTSQTPPYRTANMPMTRVSELLALPGFGIERYRRLAPHVTALPSNVTMINLCTASPYVLDSMSDQTNYTLSIESFTKARQNGCVPDKRTFNAELDSASINANAKAYYKKNIGESSNYFEANVWITIGTTQFTLYSLLYRSQTNTVGPLLRSFGTR
ncbi:MAG TPA: type II secretion system minor pseudopilin GspK [Steroidobacteraceae bacterium]|nr:type II secretion system minor pseudopilin GspK [Steroidobacteraceae bacterium]